MSKVYVDRWNPLWDHTMMRIKNAQAKCTKDGVLDYDKFRAQMITRLIRIGKDEKVYYAIRILNELGYREIADAYDAKFVLDALTEDWGNL